MASNDIHLSENKSFDMEHQLPDDENSSDRPASEAENPRSWEIIKRALLILLAIVLIPLCISSAITLFIGAIAITMLILAPLLVMVYCSLPKTTRLKLSENIGLIEKAKDGSPEEGLAAMYNKSRRGESLFERIAMGSLSMLARASLLLLFGFVLTISVPKLKTVIILGSSIWKWNLLGVAFTSVYFEALTLHLTLVFVGLLFMDMNSFYYGIYLISMSFVTYFATVLVLWQAYFSTDIGIKHHQHEAFEYVKWSLVSLLLGSILWVFKAFIVLKWSADAIYRRFEPRILVTGIKYCFVGLLAADVFDESIIGDLKVLDQYGIPNSNHPLKSTVTKYVMSRKMDLIYIDMLSRKLKSLAQIVSPLLDRVDEDDNYSDAVQWFQDKIQGTTDKCGLDGLLSLLTNTKLVKSAKSTSTLKISKQHSTKITTEEDDVKKNEKIANVLHKIVLEECSSSEFTFDDLKIWMVDAYKDCINMGRTLADAEAIVTRLDAFLSCVIFVIFLLLWLLITGLASTTVLVTIATPLLALTFIFGDTAKTFFQGFLFCFATHPFDVGDRCILDETELEVKSMSILTTTFIKIGTKEKRLYPNSVLATKAIVNLGWQPDPTDIVELTLASSTNLENLDAKIQEFFNKESTRYKVNSYKMMIKEAGDNIKVVIKFTHVLTVHDLSHGQCLLKKSDQRSNFLKVIKLYINDSQIKPINVKDENEITMPYPDPSQPLHSTTSEIVEFRKDD